VVHGVVLLRIGDTDRHSEPRDIRDFVHGDFGADPPTTTGAAVLRFPGMSLTPNDG
jgi:hypothetical protein